MSLRIGNADCRRSTCRWEGVFFFFNEHFQTDFFSPIKPLGKTGVVFTVFNVGGCRGFTKVEKTRLTVTRNSLFQSGCLSLLFVLRQARILSKKLLPRVKFDSVCGKGSSTICSASCCCTRSCETDLTATTKPSSCKFRSKLEILATSITPLCSQILS